MRSSEATQTTERPSLDIVWSQDLETAYFLKDHAEGSAQVPGSVRATVDENADVVGYEDYDPWGMRMKIREDFIPEAAGKAAY